MGCAVRATETHNATKRSIFAWWGYVFQAALKSPAGFVGADRAKVQERIIWIVGTIRDLAIWLHSPECKNFGWGTDRIESRQGFNRNDCRHFGPA
jgi:hypothetical protein